MTYTYDRRTAKLSLDVRTPLYGHTDFNSAYVVDDYPYGRERTEMRFWLEHKGKRGWRLVRQSLNPKNGRWNKPKASTYNEWAANMYLDSKGHVQWAGLGAYSGEEDFLEFLKHFPKTDKTFIKAIVPRKIAYLDAQLSGKARWTINGKPVEVTEADISRWENEKKSWEQIARLV